MKSDMMVVMKIPFHVTLSEFLHRWLLLIPPEYTACVSRDSNAFICQPLPLGHEQSQSFQEKTSIFYKTLPRYQEQTQKTNLRKNQGWKFQETVWITGFGISEHCSSRNPFWNHKRWETWACQESLSQCSPLNNSIFPLPPSIRHIYNFRPILARWLTFFFLTRCSKTNIWNSILIQKL